MEKELSALVVQQAPSRDPEDPKTVKPLKMLGLSMVAAIAAMALVGASSASASTAICKANELPCSAANTYGSGTQLLADLESGTTAKLLSSLGTVECSVSHVSGETTSGLGASVTGKITGLTFTSCEREGTACEVTVEGLNYPASITFTPGTMNGTLKVEKSRAHVVCGAFIDCTFGGTVSLVAKGGAMGLVEAKEVKLTLVEGFICPSEAKWDANYLVTAPEPLWVSE
jgi:hypothetical protein